MYLYNITKNIVKYVDFRKTKSISGDLAFFIFILLIFLLIFGIAYLPDIQSILFGKNNDLIFPSSMALLFPFSVTFFLMFFIEFINGLVIDIIKKSKKNYVKNADTLNKDNYLEKLNRNYNIFLVAFLIILIFASIISITAYIKINDFGLHINKIYSENKYYSWRELKSVEVLLSKSNSPEFIIDFGEYKKDIWEGAGLGTPNVNKLIKLTDLIMENSNIEISVNDNFNEENIKSLNKNSSAMYNITEFYNYLRKMQ